MSESEHIFTHNAAGQAVVHKAFGETADRSAAPLCGFMRLNPRESISDDWPQVTCLDCQAAKDE